jgi:hypothetical protein
VHSRKVGNFRTHVSGSGSPLLLQSAEPWRHVRCSRASALLIFSKIPFGSARWFALSLSSLPDLFSKNDVRHLRVRALFAERLISLFRGDFDFKSCSGGYMSAACRNGRDKDGISPALAFQAFTLRYHDFFPLPPNTFQKLDVPFSSPKNSSQRTHGRQFLPSRKSQVTTSRLPPHRSKHSC